MHSWSAIESTIRVTRPNIRETNIYRYSFIRIFIIMSSLRNNDQYGRTYRTFYSCTQFSCSFHFLQHYFTHLNSIIKIQSKYSEIPTLLRSKVFVTLLLISCRVHLIPTPMAYLANSSVPVLNLIQEIPSEINSYCCC
jgi:hypothetical protein